MVRIEVELIEENEGDGVLVAGWAVGDAVREELPALCLVRHEEATAGAGVHAVLQVLAAEYLLDCGGAGPREDELVGAVMA